MRTEKTRICIRVSRETKEAWHEAVFKARRMGMDADQLLKKMIELFNEFCREARVY